MKRAGCHGSPRAGVALVFASGGVKRELFKRNCAAAAHTFVSQREDDVGKGISMW